MKLYIIPIIFLLSLSLISALPVCTNANIQVNITRNGISTPLSATLDLGVYGWVTNTTSSLVNYYTKTQVEGLSNFSNYYTKSGIDTIISSENTNNTNTYYSKANPSNFYNTTNLTSDQYVKNQSPVNFSNITANSLNINNVITNGSILCINSSLRCNANNYTANFNGDILLTNGHILFNNTLNTSQSLPLFPNSVGCQGATNTYSDYGGRFPVNALVSCVSPAVVTFVKPYDAFVTPFCVASADNTGVVLAVSTNKTAMVVSWTGSVNFNVYFMCGGLALE